jgi:uncharacterized protein YndB with AHSA1/START domain
MGRTDTASRIVAASPDAVYRAFSTAESLMAWLPPGGMSGRALAYDFRPDGRYRIELTYDDAARCGAGKTTARTDVSAGSFLALEPPRRIIQTVEFESNDSAFAGQMLMTWSFEAVPEGTRVTISADNVPLGISAADHAAGLRASLENLAKYLGS